ncbi:hypothetical protein BSL78_22086 [Apostichopus japonicus]|uniref:Uncharacterized protein n=1 Tax=Stichopus japonicus TaxID=307972 RepID=A0A2G8JZ66_STIJA|nr:hypothetical protein BSL78_22086 [Apostichopus japonicus]
MTLLGRQTVKSLLGSQKGSTPSTSAGVFRWYPNTPPGAQYYITAKSTDQPSREGDLDTTSSSSLLKPPPKTRRCAQGQSQSKLSQAQTIILQSPTTSPTRTSSGKSLQVMSLPQGAKRVLTEPAQTLPVSEGTVEITRTLTETVAEVKPSPQTTAVLNEVIVTKTRSPATTSYARLPGLSPIKPPPSTSQAASTILIKKEVNQDGKKLEGLQQQQAVHVKKLPSDGKPPPQLKDPRKAIGAVQVVTVTEKGGEEKITIKAEPIDDYPEVSKMKGPPPLQLITTPQTISNKQITSRIISPQSTTIQGLPVKNPQDGVLKVSADPLMKQEISSTLATESRAITRLADPTSRVIITKLTSPTAASPSSKPIVGQGSLGETVKSSPSGPSSMLMVSGSSSQPAASSSSSLMVTQSARSSTPGTAVVGAVRIKQESGTESRIQQIAAAPPAKAQTYLDQPQLLRWCAKLNLKVTDASLCIK